jgi:hypothetical protein
LVTLGIRTFTNGIDPYTHGNQIIGNKITDLMQGICDGHSSSLIMGNMMANSIHNPRSIGINCGRDTSLSPHLANSFGNVAAPVKRNEKRNDGTSGGFAILSGAASPPVQAGPGSLYLPRDGSPPLHRSNRDWVPLNQPGTAKFSELSAAPEGTLVYVTDGTTGTSPLTGGGHGCLAVRGKSSWRGL